MTYGAATVIADEPSLLRPIPPEILGRRLGCGSAVPDDLAGKTVLDLGSGAGTDCFIAAQLAGPRGQVIGVELAPELVAIATRAIPEVMEALDLPRPTVRFIEARFEELPLPAESVDVVIANCAINLSPDKERVFAEVARVLRPGGELSFAEIVADRRLPLPLLKDERLYLECLGGAAYRGDLRRILARAGFLDVRTVASRPLEEDVDGVHFEATTFRAFRLSLEDTAEDYGQIAVYGGTIDRREKLYPLDLQHRFEAGRAHRLSKNTADILRGSRFARHFSVSEEVAHLGPFEIREAAPEPARSARRRAPEPIDPSPPEIELDTGGADAEIELGDWTPPKG